MPKRLLLSSCSGARAHARTPRAAAMQPMEASDVIRENQELPDDLVPLLDSVAGLLEKERELGELKLEAARSEAGAWRDRYEQLKGTLPEGADTFVARAPSEPPPPPSTWEMIAEVEVSRETQRQRAVWREPQRQRAGVDTRTHITALALASQTTAHARTRPRRPNVSRRHDDGTRPAARPRRARRARRGSPPRSEPRAALSPPSESNRSPTARRGANSRRWRRSASRAPGSTTPTRARSARRSSEWL